MQACRKAVKRLEHLGCGLALRPAWSRNHWLAVGRVRRIHHAILPILHLRDQDGVLVLTVGVKPDGPERSGDIQVANGIANLHTVSRLSVTDGLGHYTQGNISLHGVISGMRSVTFKEFGIKFPRTCPLGLRQPL